MRSALTALVLVATQASASAVEEPVRDELHARVLSINERMDRAFQGVRTATFTLHRIEYVNGVLNPEERIFVHHRLPNDFYLRWEDDVHPGREILYRPGWNDDELRVKPGSAYVPNVNLDPLGAIAMRGQRHPIFHTGFPFIVETVRDTTRRVEADPSLELALEDLGSQMIFGARATCYEVTLDRDREPALYGHRVEVCANEATGLPARIRVWRREDGEIRMIEMYGFEDVTINPALTDATFDPDNPAYGF